MTAALFLGLLCFGFGFACLWVGYIAGSAAAEDRARIRDETRKELASEPEPKETK